MKRRAVAVLVAALVVGVWCKHHARPRPRTAFQRGVALGLFASDPEWDYGGMVDEIAALGASVVDDSGP